MPSEKKIQDILCENHLSNLLKGEPCEACPIKLENIYGAKKMTNELNTDGFYDAVILELQSIRRLQQDQRDDLKKIEHILEGNGKPGLVEDVISLKTLINHSNRKSNEWISWVGIVLATIISACALVATITSSQ